MLELFLNTTTREWFDADGNPFAANMPMVAYQAHEDIVVFLKRETPGAGELGVNPRNWPMDENYCYLPNVAAKLTVDSDFIHKLRGDLSAAVNNGDNTIRAKISNATQAALPQTGIVRLFDDAGNTENLRYQARTIADNGEVTFLLAEGITAAGNYGIGDDIDCDQAPYVSIFNHAQYSDWERGRVYFEFVADSKRLREEMDYSDTGELPAKGMELLIFQATEDGTQTPVNAFLLETFTISGTLGSLDNNAELPDPLKNEVAALMGAFLTPVTETIDLTSANASLVVLANKYYQFTLNGEEAKLASLTISGFSNSHYESVIEVVFGDAEPQVSVPANLVYLGEVDADGNPKLAFESNKRYMISVQYGTWIAAEMTRG